MKKIMRNILIAMLIFSLSCFYGQPLGAEASSTKTKEPAKATITSASLDREFSTIDISWKRVKQANGYQVAYKKSTASSYKKEKLEGKNSTEDSIYVNSTKSAYNVKVRAYRKVKENGKTKTYYGPWSKVKIINQKKMVKKPSSTNKNSGSSSKKPSSGSSSNSGNSGGSGSGYSGSGSGSSGSGNNGNGSGGYVWIPRTGTKYHSTSTCSGMKNPSKVTVSQARSWGYTPCKKCY